MSFSDVSRALAQPVRYRVLAGYLARIGLFILFLKCVPVIVAWLAGDWHFLVNQSIVLALLAAICLPLSRLQMPEDIKQNEVIVISALSFVLAAVLETLPLAGENIAWLDALFEAVSGVTTTGLSTLTQLEDRSDSLLFVRAWMQWYGGLGIVLFSVGLFFWDTGLAARRLTLGDITDERDILGNARHHSLKLLVVYGILTLFAIGLLLFLGLTPLSAVTHALSGVSTGGFSIYNDSLAAFESTSVRLAVTLCGVLGAISLPFYYRLFRNGLKEISFNPETLALPFLSASIIGLLFFSSSGYDGDGFARAEQAVILGFSAQTTTGFANVDVGALDAASKLTLIVSMLIGGSIGSTSGGIKILRLLIALRLLQFFIERTALPPHAVLERQLSGDKLESDEIEKALMLILIFAGTVLCSWLPFLWLGYDPLNALFEVVSACSTTGLSTGITRTALEPELKGVLIADMLLGRVEFLAFLVLLYPRTWIKLRS